ncbi:MAG: TGS domain-containing protein [Thermodesulfobacteriota bacterium]|jgi:small GTP-binding protein|nr:MAG: TGS domain-containing protein [Thermodesulfobacteriota bacterium]
MPANLTPQYYEAEKNYRQAKNPSEKILALETMLAIMPKHKGTDKLRADLRRKISQLKEDTLKKSGGKRGQLFDVIRSGAGQVVLIGFPNSGKSQLVGRLTQAKPDVGEYPYTTHSPVPGMMEYQDIKIQLVDIPSILDESARGWLINVVRNADALLMVVDLSDEPETQTALLLEELEKYKIKPDWTVNAEEVVFLGKKMMIVGNKLDAAAAAKNFLPFQEKFSAFHPIAVSAAQGKNLESLRNAIFTFLKITRAYTKTPGKEPDLKHPVILKKGSTVLDFAAEIHKDFAEKLQYARIWGSEKYKGQRVQRDHLLEDGDIIELHI